MKIVNSGQGFTIFIGDIELFEHTIENPMIFVGIGNEQIEMYRGNFKIDDNIYSRIPLTGYKIVRNDNSIMVNFEEKLSLEFLEENDLVKIKFSLNDEVNINRVWIRLKSSYDEKIYGLGEQMSYFNLKGRSYRVWTSEPGVGRDKSTYVTWRSDVENKAGGDYDWSNFPQPTYISKRGYYFHLDSTAYSNFDFRDDNYIEIGIWEVPDKIVIKKSNSLLESVKSLSNLLGRQPELPEWVYNGLVIGAQGGSERVKKIVEDSLKNDIRVSGVWCQDWCGKKITSFGERVKWSWEYDGEYDPKLPEFIDELDSKGIKFLGYINPYILLDSPLYVEGVKNDYFAKDKDGDVYLVDFGEFYCGVVDFTNPDAFEWFKKVIKENIINFGMSGWMADFGEYLPTDVKLFNGNSAKIEHNRWPMLWAKCNYEALKETGNVGKIVYFMRAGAAGSQKYCTLLWAGDQSVDFTIHDGLISAVKGALSSAMTSMMFTHSDIGGYTSLFGNVRTKELFQRWTEMAAFTPFMRTHEGNRPKENFQYYNDEETMRFLGRFTRIYVSLKEYIKKYVKIASEEGIPIQRPLVLNYEDDSLADEIDTQYLFGRDLLVAPIYEEESVSRDVYLPEDNWIHLWTGKEYGSGTIRVDAPLGYPPVFYRKSSEFKTLFEKIKDIK